MPAIVRQPDEDGDTVTTSSPSPRPKPVYVVVKERVAVIVISRVRQQLSALLSLGVCRLWRLRARGLTVVGGEALGPLPRRPRRAEA